MNGYVSPRAGDISFLKNPQAWADFGEYTPQMKTHKDRQIRLGVAVNPSSKFLELDLSRRGLDEIPAETYNFSRIEKLKISNNKIRAIANGISHMHRLKILDAHKNLLTQIPDTILNCHYLTELNLNHNKLCSLPKNFRIMSSLKVLSLANNCFETLPHDVAHLENLKTLDMQGNKLWHLPFNIQNLRHLTSLNIGDNLFEHVPIPVCNIKNMEVLNLKGNKLINVPTDFENLKLLTELNISNNQFETVPYIIGDMRNLQFLNMAGNQLKFLPPRLTRMAKLKTLHVQHNQIGTIPNCFDNLEYLNIGHNKLRNFSVAKMKRLKSLNASHNDLENLPMGLCNLPHMEHVKINNNQIRFISQDIVLLRHLRTLDLSHNKLTSLPQVIDELDKLEYFSIKGNKIESRPQLVNSQNMYSEDLFQKRSNTNKQKSFFNWPFKTKTLTRTRKPLDSKPRGQSVVKRGDESKYPKYKMIDYLEGAKPKTSSPRPKHKSEKKPSEPITDIDEMTDSRVTTPPPVSKIKRPVSDIEDTTATVTSTQDTNFPDQSQTENSTIVPDTSVDYTQMSTTTDYALIGLCNQVEALLNRELLQPIISHKVNSKHSSIPSPTITTQETNHTKDSLNTSHTTNTSSHQPSSNHHSSHHRPSSNQNSSHHPSSNQNSAHPQSSNHHSSTQHSLSNQTAQPLVVRNKSESGQAWLLRTKSETFMVTQYGGTFRSKVDPNVKLFVPPNAVILPTEVALQIEKVDQEGLTEAKKYNQDKLLANLISIGDIIHTEQNSPIDFLKPVTMVIPAPPTIKRGKLHIMSYNADNSCAVTTTPYRQQRGYLTFQTWKLSGGKGAVMTKAKCKYKASRSVEVLLSHLYL